MAPRGDMSFPGCPELGCNDQDPAKGVCEPCREVFAPRPRAVTGPLVLGVDPGSKWCGLVLVRGRDDLVAWDLLERAESQTVKDWVEESFYRVRLMLWPLGENGPRLGESLGELV